MTVERVMDFIFKIAKMRGLNPIKNAHHSEFDSRLMSNQHVIIPVSLLGIPNSQGIDTGGRYFSTLKKSNQPFFWIAQFIPQHEEIVIWGGEDFMGGKIKADGPSKIFRFSRHDSEKSIQAVIDIWGISPLEMILLTDDSPRE